MQSLSRKKGQHSIRTGLLHVDIVIVCNLCKCVRVLDE